MGTNTATAVVGINVSKDALDACLILAEGKTKEATFANDPKGHAALVSWADRHAKGQLLHFCMEATGTAYRRADLQREGTEGGKCFGECDYDQTPDACRVRTISSAICGVARDGEEGRFFDLP